MVNFLRKVWIFLPGHVCTTMAMEIQNILFGPICEPERASSTHLRLGGTRHKNICGPHWVVLIQNSSGKNNLKTKAKQSYSVFKWSTSRALKPLLGSCSWGESIMGVLWSLFSFTVLFSGLLLCARCFIEYFSWCCFWAIWSSGRSLPMDFQMSFKVFPTQTTLLFYGSNYLHQGMSDGSQAK